jgi:hypothetical protein
MCLKSPNITAVTYFTKIILLSFVAPKICPGRVVNNPTSYSGGSGFDSLLRRPAIFIEVLLGFPQCLQASAWIVP